MKVVLVAMVAAFTGCTAADETVSPASVPAAGVDGGSTGGHDGGMSSSDAGGILPGGLGNASSGGDSSGGGGGGGGGGGPTMCPVMPPIVLATGVNDGKRLVVDDTNVYYEDAVGPGGVYSVPKTGGAAAMLSGIEYFGDVSSWDIAVDDENLYVMRFGHYGPSGGSDGGVLIQPKAGGANRFVYAPAIVPCQNVRVWRLAAIAGEVYLIESSDAWRTDCQDHYANRIVRIGRGAYSGFAIASAEGARAITADATHVFWTADAGAFRANHDGSDLTLLTSHSGDRIAADDSQLWIVDGNILLSVPAPNVLVARYDGAAALVDVVSDGAHAYFSGAAPTRIDPDGTQVTALATGPSGDLAVDDQFVYYFANGNVMKACK